MKRVAARAAIALMDWAATWSQASRNRLGRWLGDLLWLVAVPRRRVTRINLRLCFPELSEAQRHSIARRCYRNLARAVIDHGKLARAGAEEIERYVRVEGVEHLLNHGGRPTIVIAPHFAGLDAGGVRMAQLVHAVSIFARSRNPEWDRWLLQIRNRFNEPLLIQRDGFDLRAVVRALERGLPFYYLPDQDAGSRNGLFVPFFGVDAATLPMVPRLAKMSNARVVMGVTEMTDDGYVLHYEPAWDNYPSGDIQADTARMNREIERWVRRLPDQYLWTHKRFKTRPVGQPAFYAVKAALNKGDGGA